jgi:phosphohistidine phosphatase
MSGGVSTHHSFYFNQPINNTLSNHTMKTFYLIRHAKSDWAQIGQRDFLRPLAERGHRDAPIMASFLKNQGVQFDLIVSSPAERALTTAQYFAGRMEIPIADISTDMKIYNASLEDMIEIISDLPDNFGEVALFGHNPTFTYAGFHFSGKQIIDDMPTCSVVQLKSTAKIWAEVDKFNTSMLNFWFPKGIK